MAGRIALTFSLFLGLCACALAGPYSDLQHALESAKSPEARFHIVSESPLVQKDPALRAIFRQEGDNFSDQGFAEQRVEEAVAIRAQAESPDPHPNLKAVASEIENNPVYTNRGERESANWLGEALAKLRNLRWNLPKSKAHDTPAGDAGPWITYGAWTLLIAALLTFLFLGLKQVDFKKLKRSQKRGALVEEEEEERTLDEWLVTADRLEREGRHREAVRCLYLACLLKIDEARIARFDRGQTNWEHLSRIEASARRPAGLEFRKPTQAFDRIWYGYQVRGSEDVEMFRGWYREIVDATKQVAA